MQGCIARPDRRDRQLCASNRLPFKVFLNTQTLGIKISDLALRKGIALLGKRHMPFKTLFVLLRFKIPFYQFVAAVELSARLVITL